jgi:uncharacterized delta-60 repeat protein
MLRIFLLTSLFLIFTQAKPLQIEWDKTYGADKEEKAYGIVGTRDGGIAIAGTTRSFSAGKEDAYILKTDEKGALLWEKRVGGTRKDIAYAIDENSKGELYVAGISKSYSKEGDYDVYALKFSKNGKLLWGKSLGGPGKDYADALTATKDGGVVIVGKTKSFGHGHYDMYVIKLSSSGKVLWSKTFGGASNEEAHSVTELKDGSLIIAGGTESFGAGDFDFYIVKLSAEGKKLWEKYYGEKKADMFYTVTSSPDGGFTAAGYTRSYNAKKKDLTVMHCDKEGNTIWHKIVGKHNHEIANGIVSTKDGILVVGSTKSKGHGKNDFYILTFDNNGQLTSDKVYGGKKNDIANSVAKTIDGGYAIAGESESFTEDSDYDVYLMKLR